MDKRKTYNYNYVFKSQDEMIKLFKISDGETWKDRGNNFDVVETNLVYANGGQIRLSSNVFLLDELIVLCSVVYGHDNIFIKHIPRRHVYKVEFLDNIEREGAAIVLTIPTRSFWTHLKLWLTPESHRYDNESSKKIIITIPVMNSSSGSIYRITRRLHEFCNPSTNNNKSYAIPFEIINFHQFEMTVSPFKLKPITCNSNESCGEKIIIFKRNDYSIKTSNEILSKFLLEMRESVEGDSNNDISSHLKVIRNDEIFKKYVNSILHKSKNVETNETYKIHGKAFCSLFKNEWLHSDMIDSYLNEWRMRMKKPVGGIFENNKTYYKIFNTLLYTRLTRGMTCNSTEDLDDSSLYHLQMNASRISSEKVYSSPTVFTSIFDFNFLIVPIHATNHWLTGIVYKPRNCLRRRHTVSSMESDDNDCTYIIIYDSLTNKLLLKSEIYSLVLTQYIKACSDLKKDKDREDDFYFDERKIRTVKLKGRYRQSNTDDCGLFMLEFIRQVCINPDLLEKLANGQLMKNVFHTFSPTSGRSYLKSFVYSKLCLKEWFKLYEMEEYYLANVRNKKFRCLRTRSYDCIDWSGMKHIKRILKRTRRRSI
uniref:ULP_PROTEASE domain-containing protein n=1 Tax=Strongyloides venezuelensis TaxID=75913 RepID=A0A0K0FM43_STRVS